ELVFSKFLRQYPGLKIALSEGGIGWVPYFLERADYVYEHHHYWTHQDFGKQKPSDVFREHIITCFIDDPCGGKNRELGGIDTITWESDYPLSDTTWPHAPERLAQSLGRVGRRRAQDHARERDAALLVRPVRAHPEGAVHRGRAARGGQRRRPLA